MLGNAPALCVMCGGRAAPKEYIGSDKQKGLRQCNTGWIDPGRAALVQTCLQLICCPQQHEQGLQESWKAGRGHRWKRCRQEMGKKGGGK